MRLGFILVLYTFSILGYQGRSTVPRQVKIQVKSRQADGSIFGNEIAVYIYNILHSAHVISYISYK